LKGANPKTKASTTWANPLGVFTSHKSSLICTNLFKKKKRLKGEAEYKLFVAVTTQSLQGTSSPSISTPSAIPSA
jgi:hypothetical protein